MQLINFKFIVFWRNYLNFIEGNDMSKGKNFKKENKHSKIKILISIMQTVCIIFIIYSGIRIVEWYTENKHNNKMLDEISETIKIDNNDYEKDSKINFSELKKINSDIVAWIKINNIDVEYPIVKSSNNDFYLSHSLDKSNNSAGWLFADYRNVFDGNDKNTIIYGHNRKDGSMFGNLKNTLKEEWYENELNHKIKFITEMEESNYQVFSIYKIEREDYYITTNFNKGEYLKFLNTIKNRSVKDFGIELNENSQILTLSTCDNNNKYRIVLHAVKIK